MNREICGQCGTPLEMVFRKERDGFMKPNVWRILQTAIEEGVRHGVRRAYKHTDEVPPTESQMDTIQEEIMNSITEWFYFDD